MIDAPMARKFSRVSGCSVCTQVLRRGASGKVEKTHPARDEVGIIDVSNPERTVDALREQVEMPLVAGQGELDAGVSEEECRQSGDRTELRLAQGAAVLGSGEGSAVCPPHDRRRSGTVPFAARNRLLELGCVYPHTPEVASSAGLSRLGEARGEFSTNWCIEGHEARRPTPVARSVPFGQSPN